jgi:hypothetical protein
MGDLRKFISTTIREFLNEHIDYDFRQGDCDLYAVALHRLYGYPLYVVRNYYPNGEYEPDEEDYNLYGIDTEECHIVVKLPNGNFLDSDGEISEKKLIKQCLFGNKIGKIKIERISEEEALSIFGGCDYNASDKNSHINKVISYIKNKSV